MKKILTFFSIQNLKETFLQTSKRFPFSSILLLLIFGVFIYLNNFQEDPKLHQEELLRINFSFIITFFLSVGLYIFAESEKYSLLKTQGIQSISAIFGIGFYLYFGNNFGYENTIFFIITTFGVFSFIFFAGFLNEVFGKNTTSQNTYYNYLVEIIKVISVSVIIGFLSSILGFIAINAVDSLFNLEGDTWKQISNWFIFSCSLLAPFYALSHLIKKENITENRDSNTVSLFFVNYIIFPFSILYFLILYAYSIKVLANFGDWPKGQISWLVIGFSAFSYLAYIASYAIQSKNIIFLRKIIPFAVIPQTFMLFYAIYLRIASYGLTINRYLVVVFGGILLSISLYLIFSKRKFLALIPFLLTVFSIIISVGPWSIYHLPQKSQLQLLKQDLQKANILQEGGKIVSLKSYDDIDKKLGKNIYSKINYLCNYSNCNEIKKLFSKEYETLEKKDRESWEKNRQEMKGNTSNEKYNGPSKWEIVNYITKKIKVQNYYNNYNKNHIYFNGKDINDLDIQGYDRFIHLVYANKNKYFVNVSNNFLQIDNEQITFPFNLKERLIQEIEKANKYTSSENIIFDFDTVDKQYKFIIENASLYKNIGEEKYRKDNISGVLLIGEK